MMRANLKKLLSSILVGAGVDTVGRWINRHKLLVVMYHGVTRRQYNPPVWTQLPEVIFQRQLEFLARHYQPVTLQQVIKAISGACSLPERAVLITFDDGLRNNATVAWPILRQMDIPAAIFLTVDFIETDRFFWVDELYMYLVEAARSGKVWPLADLPEGRSNFEAGDLWATYLNIVEKYKRFPESTLRERLSILTAALPFDRGQYKEDFGLLDWSQVKGMHREGLIDFGVHTATHQILTQMDQENTEHELDTSKKILEEKLGQPVKAFCYPNGRRGHDFSLEHEALLRKIGYTCAFATDRALFDPTHDNPYAVGRVPAGHDLTSYPAFFRLNAAALELFL